MAMTSASTSTPPSAVSRVCSARTSVASTPMEPPPGWSFIGGEATDVRAEHTRLTALGGVDVDAEVMAMPGAPSMFSLRDPDGNALWVTEPAPQG